MSHLTDHARYELERAGYFDKASIYDGMIGPAVLGMTELFDVLFSKAAARSRPDREAASICIDLFAKLARFKPLAPLTSDPAEWDRLGEHWSSRRSPRCYTRDLKTYYDVDESPRIDHPLSAPEPTK